MKGGLRRRSGPDRLQQDSLIGVSKTYVDSGIGLVKTPTGVREQP